MTLKHSGPDSWARKRIFLEPYCLRARPSPPLPAPLSVECPTRACTHLWTPHQVQAVFEED
jgi:hypothetical protein